MDVRVRTFLLAVASGLTTVLVAGAVTIAVLSGQYGDSPGVGMIAVAVGFFTGAVAMVAVALLADRLRGIARAGLVAYAAFGATFLAVAGMRYVNVPGADDLFTFEVHLAVSLLVAVAAAVATLAGVGPGSGQERPV